MSEARIRIAYDGEALRNGTMDVRDLAPALLALSDLFDESNKVLHGTNTAIQLRVRVVRKGSFDVELSVLQTLTSAVIDLFSGDTASALANLIETLGFAGGTAWGLFKLIKKLAQRPIRRVELLDDGQVRLVLEGDEIVISRRLADLFNDIAVRRALWRVLQPLRQPGVEIFEIRDEKGATIHQVTDAEVSLYEPPAPVAAVQQVLKSEFEQAFTIVALTFREGNKWRVFDGQNTIAVTLADESFLQKVDNREVSFAKDDTIVCRVTQRQTIGADGLRIESVITQVLEHRHAPRQTAMVYATEEDPEVVVPVEVVRMTQSEGGEGDNG